MSFCEHCGSESDLCFCAVTLPTLERQTNQPQPLPQCLVKDCVVCMTSMHGPAPAHLIDGKRVPTDSTLKSLN